MTIPMVRNVVTRAGVSVAYHTLGHGPAVLMLFPYHVNHLALNWQVPLHRGAIEFLARYFTVVNLDCRGAGLSERRIERLSLDDFTEDIEAVLTELGVASVGVVAMGPAALIACHLARRRPARVTALAFVESGESHANRHVLSLRSLHPHVEADVRGTVISGLHDARNASALAAVALHALEPAALAHWERLIDGTELLEIAAEVTQPTLCFHAAADELIPLAAGRAVVDRIPGATLHIVGGKCGMDVWRDRVAPRAMAAFLARAAGVEHELGRAQRRERKSAPSPIACLSAREAQVLALLAAGKRNQQIARELFISPNTVSYHLRRIFAKIGAANRTEAASFAHQHGLTD